MKRLLLIAAAVFCLSLAALPAGAEELRLLTWNGYAPAELVAKFEKETGHRVVITYSNNEDMIARLTASRGGGFDLAQPSQDRVIVGLQAGGIYRALDYGRIDEGRIIPALLEAVQTNTELDGEIYGVPFGWGVSGLVVNSKQAPKVTGFAALFDPAYKGRISYRLKRPVIIAAAFALGYDPFALYDDPPGYAEMLAVVTDKLMAGKDLVNNYWSTTTSLLAAMRDQEVYVAEGWDSAGFRLHAENPDIDFVPPDSGALGWIDTFAIPAKAKNLQAAYDWINFMLRPENAAVVTNTMYMATASQGAMTLAQPRIKADFDRCLPPAVIENIKWYPPLPAELEAMEAKALEKVRNAR